MWIVIVLAVVSVILFVVMDRMICAIIPDKSKIVVRLTGLVVAVILAASLVISL